MEFDFTDVFTAVEEFIYFILNALASFFIEIIDGCLFPIVSCLPNLIIPVSMVVSVLGYANYFVALDYGVILLASYVSFALSVSLIKWILGLIPGLS